MKTPKVLFLLTFLVVGWALPAAAPAAVKDTLTVGYYSKFATLDHYQSTDRATINLGYLIWDPLVQRDPATGRLKPHLAESWKALNDTTWEFKLRSGVKFHNGHPLTAEAVRFTIEDRILNPEQKSPQAGNYKWIKKIEVVNETTFRVHTDKPYPLILERFNVLFVYDPQETKEKGNAWVAEHPMGSGPFKLVKYDRDARIILQANPDYWIKGVPKLKSITLKIIPEMSTRLAELLSGGVDISENLGPDQVAVVMKNKSLKIVETPVLRISFWSFDAAGRAGQNPFQDVRVRRAIWHAIDRQAIIKTVMQGQGTLVNAPMNPLQFGFDSTIRGYEFNPAKAKALLKEAGYENGFTTELWQYEEYQNHPNQAAMGYLDQVGIKVVMRDYRGNIGQFLKVRHAGKAAGIQNNTWGSYNIFDADAILAAWFLKEDPKNYTNDEELDKWLTEARFSLDENKRKDLYAKAQKKIIDQAYWMPFYLVHLAHGLSKDFHVVVGGDEVPRYQHAYFEK